MVSLGLIIIALFVTSGVLNIIFYFRTNNPLKYYIIIKGILCFYVSALWGMDLADKFIYQQHGIDVIDDNTIQWYKRIAVFCLALMFITDSLIRNGRKQKSE